MESRIQSLLRDFSLGSHGPHIHESRHVKSFSAVAPALQVREMTSNDAARWDEFVYACPAATFFIVAGWKEVIQRAFGHHNPLPAG